MAKLEVRQNRIFYSGIDLDLYIEEQKNGKFIIKDTATYYPAKLNEPLPIERVDEITYIIETAIENYFINQQKRK